MKSTGKVRTSCWRLFAYLVTSPTRTCSKSSADVNCPRDCSWQSPGAIVQDWPTIKFLSLRSWQQSLFSPTKNLQDVARDSNITIELVCSIAQHLVNWGIVRPITQLCSHTILVLSSQTPTMTINTNTTTTANHHISGGGVNSSSSHTKSSMMSKFPPSPILVRRFAHSFHRCPPWSKWCNCSRFHVHIRSTWKLFLCCCWPRRIRDSIHTTTTTTVSAAMATTATRVAATSSGD